MEKLGGSFQLVNPFPEIPTTRIRIDLPIHAALTDERYYGSPHSGSDITAAILRGSIPIGMTILVASPGNDPGDCRI